MSDLIPEPSPPVEQTATDLFGQKPTDPPVGEQFHLFFSGPPTQQPVQGVQMPLGTGPVTQPFLALPPENPPPMLFTPGMVYEIGPGNFALVLTTGNTITYFPITSNMWIATPHDEFESMVNYRS